MNLCVPIYSYMSTITFLQCWGEAKRRRNVRFYSAVISSLLLSVIEGGSEAGHYLRGLANVIFIL